ncbi:MAG: lysine--tRNA ligase [gamma proteobacterium symbiont of Ctena orbiculata]|uniref:Lysine--tRNA ligase n=1 Tax=Candidatus Thiodiazotropha taylori TaxID=2792791 RepID=A0A944QU47_9GAMM|nr:lysine--tRNA ligase [Candidatus Thiodiazotropha taylori]PVV10739.1 MAG: lysine--tRNA ligase [gamma proteobacterium symbiont of Ctena orbiculata]MBT2988261.1 lysine--tRNA ligase [Candidatus Thiodiazotropha taylori]MBT2996229.1 lysine--tRNA ligase [Candidatus Thiodiazotropha taylori]MBT2999625.1 lysine--tRNA ligase [Candidatus Thiodiazotropha taylori]
MNDQTDENKLIAQRREKLQQLRENGNAFPNDFRRNSMAGELHAEYGEKSGEALEARGLRVRLAGRMMSRRVMGKASFAHLQDMSGRIQLFVQRDALEEGLYNSQFKKWDIGDIIGAEGLLFKTKTGELSVKVDTLRLLTKALRPLPEKFHGLSDQEIRYRQRYVDLIMNEASRMTFQMRTRIVQFVRNFLDQRGFLEVETPMMQVIPGGATARPFATRHNALDMDMFLRIAPELYLKRLVVGGFERVYEINRNFRNEGLSTRHNPEFTMLEFYEAYADFNDLMDLTEAMLRALCKEVLGSTEVSYQGERYDFGSPFQRMTVKESICHFNSEITAAMLDDEAQARAIAEGMEIPLKPSYGLGKIQIEIFEKSVEYRLMNPTFITAYPTEVSPLARRNDDDPFVTDRFEFFVGGREIANGFSELNDAEDQAERFRKQVAEKEAGDDEAMHYDADYVRALEHGMPPTAGEGIGIDRLVMLLTDSASIRDVLLFPHLRPE